MRSEDFLKGGKVYVLKKKFAVIKSKRTHPGAFANIIDRNEITVIAGQTDYPRKDAIAVEKGWRILTFDMTLPFGLVGFLAKVSGALAEEDIPIFALSAYSTDHLLVKQKDLAKAEKKLRSLGLIVKEE